MKPSPRIQLFPFTTQTEKTSSGNQLTIAGCDITKLADQFGTPLYVYDAATLNSAVLSYQKALAEFYPNSAGITYAGKAFLNLALAQWTQRHNLWVDCTGLGELRIAEAAGVPRRRTLLHGVNKTQPVLSTGISQAGTIVVDNLTELKHIKLLAQNKPNNIPDLWLRFRPGAAVETHSHIQTGQHDSKFGMSCEEIMQAAHICRANSLPFNGLHFHLGSQFHIPDPIEYALVRTLDLAKEIKIGANWTLCLGGGWGVPYHEHDLPHPSIDDFVRFATGIVVDGCTQRGIPLPHLQLEPGRSLVAQAGVAIYRAGIIKHTPNRRWILLDGGLADNPRFALYQARYTALPVINPQRPYADPAWIAGPFCESGDVIIEALPFPNIDPGELIAIPVSGAYQLSMASNYNGATRPAVLWLEDGQATLIRKRETPKDLIRHDSPLPNSETNFSSVLFHKYHGLGNDYIVVSASDLSTSLTPTQIQQICDRQRGIGSDGIVVDCSNPTAKYFSARFFNPDGSEAEKSGNGLRIFARFLQDAQRIGSEAFDIKTQGGMVKAQVHQGGKSVTVEMGKASFDSHAIPVEGPQREVINETMLIDGHKFTYSAVTVGNPHCVILCDDISKESTEKWGALIENESRFPNRTNVQFMKVLDRENIQIEIWERGAGYTLASGSSSCATAAVAYRLGLCDRDITVHMPGGELKINIDEDFEITMTGPVSKVWQGYLAEEVFKE